ncbi:MAG: succinate dehydrogenase cytochrome b subunit [Bacteroidales bacterium]|jgi:succinate dehydrogenase / fumarate reductase cytochrome b subunit|nr:succinate dehydrogenase cytochrome b subunit [Bacteroidales bacterium]
MASFLNSSIGKKFLMSITGLFLITFLLVHLIVNSLIIFDPTGALFNSAAHFMGSNPVIKIVEPVLAIGFILHIIYACFLTLTNQWARPVDYDKKHAGNSSTWASRNMFVLGSLILIFLIIHLSNFFWKIKFTGSEMLDQSTVDGIENAYLLVTSFFIDWWWIDLIYVLGAIVLGIHLTHAFWAAFQTLGLSNDRWRKRLEVIGWIYTIIVAGGFAVIPLWVKISSMIN